MRCKHWEEVTKAAAEEIARLSVTSANAVKDRALLLVKVHEAAPKFDMYAQFCSGFCGLDRSDACKELKIGMWLAELRPAFPDLYDRLPISRSHIYFLSFIPVARLAEFEERHQGVFRLNTSIRRDALRVMIDRFLGRERTPAAIQTDFLRVLTALPDGKQIVAAASDPRVFASIDPERTASQGLALLATAARRYYESHDESGLRAIEALVADELASIERALKNQA